MQPSSKPEDSALERYRINDSNHLPIPCHPVCIVGVALACAEHVCVCVRVAPPASPAPPARLNGASPPASPPASPAPASAPAQLLVDSPSPAQLPGEAEEQPGRGEGGKENNNGDSETPDKKVEELYDIPAGMYLGVNVLEVLLSCVRICSFRRCEWCYSGTDMPRSIARFAIASPRSMAILSVSM